MIEKQESLAEVLADNVVTKYALNSVMQFEDRSNLLSAAVTCGCRSCVASFFGMLDWLTQDPKMSDQIACSSGLKRNHAKRGRRKHDGKTDDAI